MWCGRIKCLSRVEYAEAMAEKRKQNGKNSTKDEKRTPGISEDFRVALAALTTAEDFASLEQQFFSGKE